MMLNFPSQVATIVDITVADNGKVEQLQTYIDKTITSFCYHGFVNLPLPILKKNYRPKPMTSQ